MLSIFLLMFGADYFLEGSFAKAQKKAQAENKLILVDVYTTWCGPCKLMDKHTFSDENVKSYVHNNLVPFKLDAERGEGPALARKFRVSGYPTVLLLNHKGEVVDKIMGFVPAKDFLAWAKKPRN